mgnify:CR=1 FL=1
MKYFSEKEKKLEMALDKLKKLNLVDEEGLKNIEFLSDQKNQLEIEKKELENKHQNLINEQNTSHHYPIIGYKFDILYWISIFI